jgi:hypothetical protein
MLIRKDELVKKIKEARKQVRILGVLPFNLNWDEFKELWLDKIDKAELLIEIICEPEHSLNTQVIIASDKRVSGEERSYELGSFRNILTALEAKLRKYFVDQKCRNLEPASDMPKDEQRGYKQCFSLRTCYLNIPIPAINIDDDYYIVFALTKFTDIQDFEKIEQNHPWFSYFSKYFKTYFDNDAGARKYSTEVTNRRNRLEVIQSFNEKREPTGLLPRDSFLNTVQVKLVVWALIFSRDGKLLIHKRKENAKDNQGMWDKSVGGHVAIDDVDTVKAAAREIAEELYKQEKGEQGGHGEMDFMEVNVDKIIFLGEWLPYRRYTIPFDDVDRRKDEYYFFRLNYPFSMVARNSKRHLPDGRIEDVLVFADVYVCIASTGFDEKNLQNSDYKLLELYELKDAYNERKINYTKNGESVAVDFCPTPDLESIMRSSMWNDLSSFSDYVKEKWWPPK